MSNKIKCKPCVSLPWLLVAMICLLLLPAHSQHSSQVDGRRGNRIYLVVGVTQSLKPFDNPNKSFQDPMLVATLKITEVLRGSEDLLGQSFEAFTSDTFIEGNTRAITPALKAGEVCICAITQTQDNNKLKMLYSAPYPVGDDWLPSIKGRKENRMTDRFEDFDGTLQRLRYLRDHPGKTQPNQPTSKKASLAEPAPIPFKSGTDAKSRPAHADVHAAVQPKEKFAAWWMASVAVTILTTGVWLLRRKKMNTQANQ